LELACKRIAGVTCELIAAQFVPHFTALTTEFRHHAKERVMPPTKSTAVGGIEERNGEVVSAKKHRDIAVLYPSHK
jgi:hypothetical protein